MRYYCIWKTGSTNKETGKPELPERCKDQNCNGGPFRLRSVNEVKQRVCFNFCPDVETIMREKHEQNKI